MRIVSRFKDYYDALRSMDREPEPLYVRQTAEIALGGARPTAEQVRARQAVRPLWTTATIPHHPPVGGRGVVGFCGRLYPFLRFGGRTFHTFRGFYDAVRNSDLPERASLLARLDGRSRYELTRREWEAFEASRARTVEDGPFRFFNAPVIVMTDDHIVVNPRLRDYELARVVDPYTAWQDISVFLGNNLVNSAGPPRPVSDELRAEAHGFDRKLSFRKAKGGRQKVDRGDW